MSRKWIEQGERSNPFTLKLICWIALNIGRGFARIWLYPITLYFFLTSSKVRFASRAYLQRVNSNSYSLWQTVKHIYYFASTILDRVFFLTDQLDKFDIGIEGMEILENHLKRKQGCILLGSHLGSFEVLRSLAINRDRLPLKILMYRDHNEMITRVLDSLNPEVADSVINLADQNAMLLMKECIEQGDMIGMLGDRVSDNEKYISVKLLGEDVNLPTGPLLLSCIMNVPVIMFFGLYLGENRYKIIIENLTDSLTVSKKDRNQVVRSWTRKYAESLEEKMKSMPYNWFNFYDYWQDNV